MVRCMSHLQLRREDDEGETREQTRDADRNVPSSGDLVVALHESVVDVLVRVPSPAFGERGPDLGPVEEVHVRDDRRQRRERERVGDGKVRRQEERAGRLERGLVQLERRGEHRVHVKPGKVFVEQAGGDRGGERPRVPDVAKVDDRGDDPEHADQAAKPVEQRPPGRVEQPRAPDRTPVERKVWQSARRGERMSVNQADVRMRAADDERTEKAETLIAGPYRLQDRRGRT